MSAPLKVLHVITGLSTGGAETMLVKILSALSRTDVENRVVALGSWDAMAERIEALGVPLVCLNSTRSLGGFPAAPRSLMRLASIMRTFRPDVVQCWMYHANLLGGLAAWIAGGPPVVWGLRQSNLDPKRTKGTTRLIARLGAKLSRCLPTRILACAESVRQVHTAMGYDASRMIVIPNGFDGAVFHPDPEARARLRHEIDVGSDTLLVGLPARFDPQKDHATLLKAAAAVRAANADVVFLLCGQGTTSDNPDLKRLISASGAPPSALRLLGERRDMPAIMAALDVVVSSSAYGEGFPNVLGEGMAAGALPIATDSGDSRAIVDGIGTVVPIGDADALAHAILDAVALQPAVRRARTDAARERILRDYALPAIAERYLALWRESAAERQ